MHQPAAANSTNEINSPSDFFFSAVTNEHVKLGWWVKNAHTELCSYSNASIVIAFFSKTILVHGVLFF